MPLGGILCWCKGPVGYVLLVLPTCGASQLNSNVIFIEKKTLEPSLMQAHFLMFHEAYPVTPRLYLKCKVMSSIKLSLPKLTRTEDESKCTSDIEDFSRLFTVPVEVMACAPFVYIAW